MPFVLRVASDERRTQRVPLPDGEVIISSRLGTPSVADLCSHSSRGICTFTQIPDDGEEVNLTTALESRRARLENAQRQPPPDVTPPTRRCHDVNESLMERLHRLLLPVLGFDMESKIKCCQGMERNSI